MTAPLRIVFLGTPDFAVHSLRRLVDDGAFEVVLVVTRPDKPVGRKAVRTAPPAKEEALRHGVPVLQPAKLRGNDEAVAAIRAARPDVLVTAAYGMILPKEVLDIALPLNVHASILPHYRGASPIQQAIIDREFLTGVTIMRMEEGLDTGPMIAIGTIDLDGTETTGSLTPRLAELGADLLADVLRAYAKDPASMVLTPQPPESPTPVTRMIKKDDGVLTFFTMDAPACEARVRAFHPWPLARTTWDGKGLAILRAHVAPGKCDPGLVVAHEGSAAVGCGLGLLVLDEVQLEGKKPMTTKDFLNGARTFVGSRLGGSDR